MLSVALDGPAGAGKSTIAKKLSQKFGFLYVDTGALYRAIGKYMLDSGVSPSDAAQVVPRLCSLKVGLCYQDGQQRVMINGEDVTDSIRTQEVSAAASQVSAIKEVRDFLFSLQRDLAKENHVMMDGRDIGTVIMPFAEVKVFMTATLPARAKRRFLELQAKGLPDTYEEVLADMEARDRNDRERETAPCVPAEDAVQFVNDDYGIEESADYIICADGGANQAYEWKVKVDSLIGDLDSIRPEALEYYRRMDISIRSFPPMKDETDTQLALKVLQEKGADEIILLGSMGGRPDHSLANLLSTLSYVRAGIKILLLDTECQIWVTASNIQIQGKPGDTVSLFSLSPKSQGVNLEGFQYPLNNADLYWDQPYAVSNVLLQQQGSISVRDGILAIMHFR